MIDLCDMSLVITNIGQTNYAWVVLSVFLLYQDLLVGLWIISIRWMKNNGLP